MSSVILNDTGFWLSIATIIGGIVIVLNRNLLRSKCSRVKFCWGCLDCERDCQLESDEHVFDVENGQTSRRDVNIGDELKTEMDKTVEKISNKA